MVIVAGLRPVSSTIFVNEEAQRVQRSVFEVRPGVQVTLTVTRALGPANDESARDLSRQRRADASNVRPPSPADAPALNAIHWSDERGTTFRLSGPLPIPELTALKARVRAP